MRNLHQLVVPEMVSPGCMVTIPPYALAWGRAGGTRVGSQCVMEPR